jgi:hypothetical protein
LLLWWFSAVICEVTYAALCDVGLAITLEYFGGFRGSGVVNEGENVDVQEVPGPLASDAALGPTRSGRRRKT